METTQQTATQNLLGRPHYELVARYGYRESLIARYETKAEAVKAQSIRQMGEDFRTLVVRRVEM